MATFEGESGMAPILGAKFWMKGKAIAGKVGGSFETKNGPCTTIALDNELMVDGSIMNPPQRGKIPLNAVSIGNMKGFEQAVARSGAVRLTPGDHVNIICTGKKDVGQTSPMVTFKIQVNRPDK